MRAFLIKSHVETAALDHEAVNHAVKDRLVIKLLIDVAQKVFYGFRGFIGEKLHGHGAVIGFHLNDGIAHGIACWCKKADYSENCAQSCDKASALH